MRDIKFRAWHKEFNIIIEPEAFNRNDIWISGDGKIYEIEEWSDYGGGGMREHDCTDKYILMQYTGLKDRNGKEIYEGDRFSKGNDVGTVVYERGSYWINWDEPYSWGIERALYRVHDEGEVIGNTYEKGADNP